jgi:hypothetical protein
MSQSPQRKDVTFGGPAVYRVVVSGSIDARAGGSLGDMRIETSGGREDGPVTTLVGRLTDQAHLTRVLNSIYEMHLPVLEVTKLE